MLALDIHLLIIKLMNFGEEETKILMTHCTLSDKIEWAERKRYLYDLKYFHTFTFLASE